MSANTFGEHFRITTFGESHGAALGVIIDGCPAGIPVDEALLRKELDRRRPGQSDLTTARSETDDCEILSGVFEGKTLGTPIAVMVRNKDAKSTDYKDLPPRAGHADDVWKNKFGHSDPRGGGRSSGRETLCRVIGGAFAKMFLRETCPQLSITSFASAVGEMSLTESDRKKISAKMDVDSFAARFVSENAAQAADLIRSVREKGDSLGGRAEVHIWNPPANLGQPVFHKLKADFASAFMSIGAVNGVELGEVSEKTGVNYHASHDSSVYGGIRGGISTGETIRWTVHFKPTSSILNVAKKGRHDPYIITRAVPVLDAMAWLVLADHVLWSRLDRLSSP